MPGKQAVIADLATDRFIGTTNWNWKVKETFWRNVGIDIYDPRNRGKGLGFEALRKTRTCGQMPLESGLRLWYDRLVNHGSRFFALIHP